MTKTVIEYVTKPSHFVTIRNLQRRRATLHPPLYAKPLIPDSITRFCDFLSCFSVLVFLCSFSLSSQAACGQLVVMGGQDKLVVVDTHREVPHGPCLQSLLRLSSGILYTKSSSQTVLSLSSQQRQRTRVDGELGQRLYQYWLRVLVESLCI